MLTLDKAIELSKEAEFSLRHHKFFDYADAVKMGTDALKEFKQAREYGLIDVPKLLPGEESIEHKPLSVDQKKRVRESPLGKKPKSVHKVNDVPETIFTIKSAQLQAITLYKHLIRHQDRQPRYTILTFCGATPQQAYRWRDWSIKHFQLIFDYLFNPEPLAEGLVNNRLGLSEAGIKSVAVA